MPLDAEKDMGLSKTRSAIRAVHLQDMHIVKRFFPYPGYGKDRQTFTEDATSAWRFALCLASLPTNVHICFAPPNHKSFLTKVFCEMLT